jgi:hypothetical protein
MKRGPHQASPLMVNNRMAGTRITVWDVLHDLETGGGPVRDGGDRASQRCTRRRRRQGYRGFPSGTDGRASADCSPQGAWQSPCKYRHLGTASHEVAAVAEAASRAEDGGCGGL